MDTPPFKMTDFRLLKLKEYLADRFLSDNPFSKKKTAFKNVSKQVTDLKVSGQINHTYFLLAKHGAIEDSELFPTKYIPIELKSNEGDIPHAPTPPVNPSKKKKKKIARMINFDEEQLHKLTQEAERRDCSYSHLVRCAVRSYLFRTA